jgi:hypothetical protein
VNANIFLEEIERFFGFYTVFCGVYLGKKKAVHLV